jgi:hypothetical protein
MGGRGRTRQPPPVPVILPLVAEPQPCCMPTPTRAAPLFPWLTLLWNRAFPGLCRFDTTPPCQPTGASLYPIARSRLLPQPGGHAFAGLRAPSPVIEFR